MLESQNRARGRRVRRARGRGPCVGLLKSTHRLWKHSRSANGVHAFSWCMQRAMERARGRRTSLLGRRKEDGLGLEERALQAVEQLAHLGDVVDELVVVGRRCAVVQLPGNDGVNCERERSCERLSANETGKAVEVGRTLESLLAGDRVDPDCERARERASGRSCTLRRRELGTHPSGT